MSDLIERDIAIEAVQGIDLFAILPDDDGVIRTSAVEYVLSNLPSAQPEDYSELKREFLRMASYIDVLLECSDEQKETLIRFISRLAEFMPWTERD